MYSQQGIQLARASRGRSALSRLQSDLNRHEKEATLCTESWRRQPYCREDASLRKQLSARAGHAVGSQTGSAELKSKRCAVFMFHLIWKAYGLCFH